jgi:hypothetical protein
MGKLFKKGDLVRVVCGNVLCYGKIFNYGDGVVELSDAVECGVSPNGELIFSYIGRVRLSGAYNMFDMIPAEFLYYVKIVTDKKDRRIGFKSERERIDIINCVMSPERGDLLH